MSYMPDFNAIGAMITGALTYGFSMPGIEFGLAKAGLDMAERAILGVLGPTVSDLPVIGNLAISLGVRVVTAGLNAGLINNAPGFVHPRA